METNLKNLVLGDFRKLFKFLEKKSGKYCLDIKSETCGDLYEFSPAICIRIYQDSDDAMIKIFDPTYVSAKEGMITLEIIKWENDANSTWKELSLSRFEEDSFYDLIEKIINFKTLYANVLDEDNEETIRQKEADIDQRNNELITEFETWAKNL